MVFDEYMNGYFFSLGIQTHQHFQNIYVKFSDSTKLLSIIHLVLSYFIFHIPIAIICSLYLNSVFLICYFSHIPVSTLCMLYFQLEDNASGVKHHMCSSAVAHALQKGRPSNRQVGYLLLKHILCVCVICLEREFRYTGSGFFFVFSPLIYCVTLSKFIPSVFGLRTKSGTVS